MITKMMFHGGTGGQQQQQRWENGTQVVAAMAGVEAQNGCERIKDYWYGTMVRRGRWLWRGESCLMGSSTSPDDDNDNECPICYSSITHEEDNWHTMTACGHATCVDCLQMYAFTLLQDHHGTASVGGGGGGVGPLLCPCCPTPLRPVDAIKALEHKPAFELWDKKLRDVALRKMKGYRTCEKCNNNNKTNADNDDASSSSTPQSTTTTTPGSSIDGSNSSNNNVKPLVGGGFATVACLEEEHKDIIPKPPKPQFSDVFLLILIPLGIAYMAFLAHKFMVKMAMALIMFMIVPFMVTEQIDYYIALRDWKTSVDADDVESWLARYYYGGSSSSSSSSDSATTSTTMIIKASCPCCDHNFSLTAVYNSTTEGPPDEDETTRKATATWMKDNTKPCPTCNSPIQKKGGCRIMKCTRCKMNFCWVCSKPVFGHAHFCF